MAPPTKCRLIGISPPANRFKPCGIKSDLLEEIRLELDELEALRLADFIALYQADAAKRMGISRQTFANIIGRAHYKVADTLTHGKALSICRGPAHKLSPMLSNNLLEESSK